MVFSILVLFNPMIQSIHETAPMPVLFISAGGVPISTSCANCDIACATCCDRDVHAFAYPN
jgi:hypothetical protein